MTITTKTNTKIKADLDAKHQRRESLVSALEEVLLTMTPSIAAAAIVDGTLHPAIQIKWSSVLPSDDFCPF
jgi:hypothetical protein